MWFRGFIGALCLLQISGAIQGAIPVMQLQSWKRQACLNIDETNGQFTCTPEGEVQCSAGWTGDVCNVPVCKKGCNPQFGYCNKPDECRCKMGFSGEFCEKCAVLPGCQHGSCNQSFECNCHEGWDGLFCNQPICKAGCHTIRGFCDRPGECKCRFGWSGEKCESCQTMPGCKNGYCKKPLECKCQEGWTGLFCSTPICNHTCDVDHGYCENPGECRCHVGWWGANCNECFPYPGCVHGTCRKPWECNCEPGWGGFFCDRAIPYCEAHPQTCMNGGICESLSVEAGNFSCICRGDFEGQYCEKNKSWPVTNRTESESVEILTNTTVTDEESTIIGSVKSIENFSTESYEYDESTEMMDDDKVSENTSASEVEESLYTTLSSRRKNNRIALLSE